MQLYFVKRPLFGIGAGRVERFHHSRAALLESEGSIEKYNDQNKEHRAAAERDGYATKIETPASAQQKGR